MTMAARGGLYASVMLVFGVACFRLRLSQVDTVLDVRFRRIVILAAIVGLLFSIIAFLAMVAGMTGTSSFEANAPIARMLLVQTPVGHAGLAREALLAIALIVGFAAARWAWPTTMLAGMALATLAWSGHGAMDEGWRGALHLAMDVAHLLAAGAWIGALVALLLLALRATGRPSGNAAVLASASIGFASTGTLIVIVLGITGIANYLFIAGPEWKDLVSSTWGIVLLAKLAVFGLMLMLAAANRYRFAPRLASSLDSDTKGVAIAHLRRSLWLELTLGLTVLALVGWLGTLAPDA